MTEQYPEIKRTIAIVGGALKRDPWTISSSEHIDGAEFVMLQGNDTGFNRFVTGQPNSKGGKFVGAYLRTLRKERNHILAFK